MLPAADAFVQLFGQHLAHYAYGAACYGLLYVLVAVHMHAYLCHKERALLHLARVEGQVGYLNVIVADYLAIDAIQYILQFRHSFLVF